MQGNIWVALAVFMPMAAAIVSVIIGRINKNIRDYFAWTVCGLELLIFISFLFGYINGGLNGELVIPGFAYLGLYFTLDGFRVIYGLIAAFMWFISTLFSKEYFAHYRNRNRYYLFLLITLGATEGVFLSADLYTTFIFFEIMSFTSYVWVGHDEREESLRAAGTYLAVAVIGGLVMLMGLFLLYDMTGTLRMQEILPAVRELGNSTRLYAAGVCLAFGFGAKAGAFPLHIWLPKAHPVAPAPASALLSGILTKAGMFGILFITANIFLYDVKWGTFILIIGVFTMVIGAVLALFSIDLKRTLACSSVSQIGFILVGVGMQGLLGEENALAVRGSLLHMVNHSMIKLALFCAAGVVYMNIHKLDLNEIRGFGRKKPILNFIFLMGALGIGGVPFWNGYISKTLIHEAIVEYTELLEEGVLQAGFLCARNMKVIEWLFLISGGITVAYMTKLYLCLFVERNTDPAKENKYEAMSGKYMNPVSSVALVVAALMMPILGFGASCLMNGIADMGQGFMHLSGEVEAINYYSRNNLKGGLISISIGVLIYLLVVRGLLMTRNENGEKVYADRWPKWLDLEDYIYRPILLYALPAIGAFVSRICDSLVDTAAVIIRKTILKDSPLPYELEEGTAFTHAMGRIANRFEQIGNRIFRRGKTSHEVDYEHKFATMHEKRSENSVLIKRSMSFGLLLFCIGLLFTLIYLVTLTFR